MAIGGFWNIEDRDDEESHCESYAGFGLVLSRWSAFIGYQEMDYIEIDPTSLKSTIKLETPTWTIFVDPESHSYISGTGFSLK